MNIESFWKIIDSAKEMAEQDVDARIDTLRTLLSHLTPAELQSFQNHYDEQIRVSYRWGLWAAAYIINGGCSDDGFRYFRDWLISEGRSVFEAALKDPDSLADLPHVDPAELEAFGYVALDLYEEKAAGELERDFSTEGAEPTGEPWEEDSVGELLPRLDAKYG
jgi:hypothetical protein